MKQAMGVLVAPEKTAMKPSAARNGPYICSRPARECPRVEPITNKGVTSPPWNPEPRVIEVNRSFHKKANGETPSVNEEVIKGIPNPK